jgi:hypothetical protein
MDYVANMNPIELLVHEAIVQKARIVKIRPNCRKYDIFGFMLLVAGK